MRPVPLLLSNFCAAYGQQPRYWHLADIQQRNLPSSRLIGSGTVAQALEALQKSCVSSRLVALGDSGC